MNALETALDDTRSHARGREQKLLITTKELKASTALFIAIAHQTRYIAHSCASWPMLGSNKSPVSGLPLTSAGTQQLGR